jgi:hypothetical protein
MWKLIYIDDGTDKIQMCHKMNINEQGTPWERNSQLVTNSIVMNEQREIYLKQLPFDVIKKKMESNDDEPFEVQFSIYYDEVNIESF